MPDKQRQAADEKLIKKLFNLSSLDWARYPDGRLVFIAPNGAKFSCTDEDLKALSASAAKSSQLTARAVGADTQATMASSLDAKSSPSKPELEHQPEPEIKPEAAPTSAGARPAPQGADGAPPSTAADAAAPALDFYPQATE